MACGRVMIFCEVVVQYVLGCGCVGFGIGVWARVEGVLLWGIGMWSGVLRECYFSKRVCNMFMIWNGFVVTSLVFGSRMAASLGWSVALGCRFAAVLRLLW